MEKELYIKEIRPGVWLMDEAHEATGYLVAGKEKACVIDTMNAYTDLYAAVRKLTDKPLVVVNTHGHPDHIFGNVYFEEAYLNPADTEMARQFTESEEYLELSREKGWTMPPFRDIFPGDVIDLGGRRLEVIHLPGHTPGSIALLDAAGRVLISGDPIQDGRIYMFGPFRSMRDYAASLERLRSRAGQFDEIWPSHADLPVSPDVIPKLRDGAQAVLDGKIKGTPREMHGNTIMVYDLGFCALLCGQ